VGLADNPQQTIRELRELVVAYAKQEAVDPLKALGKWVGLHIAGALLIGMGCMFIAIGALRVIQDQTAPHLTGNWSWVPYLIVIIGLLIVVGIVMAFRQKAMKRKAPTPWSEL
jgi:phosphotransferase system  glucose/maltose/N-acetylglucosamine-specific IIC component